MKGHFRIFERGLLILEMGNRISFPQINRVKENKICGHIFQGPKIALEKFKT